MIPSHSPFARRNQFSSIWNAFQQDKLIALVKLSDCRVERSQTLFRWSFDVIIARINYQYSTRYGRPFRNVFIPYGHPERWCGHWTQYWIQPTETSFCAAEATRVTKYLLPRLLLPRLLPRLLPFHASNCDRWAWCLTAPIYGTHKIVDLPPITALKSATVSSQM